MNELEAIEWMRKRNKNLKLHPTGANPLYKRRHDEEIERNEICIAALQSQSERKQNDGWISVKDGLPDVETEVFILCKCRYGNRNYYVRTTAIYEDGKMPSDDSIWNWYDVDFDYDEENDQCLIPQGWWEYRHYNPDDVYNNAVDDEVVAWQPLPEPPKEDAE